MTLDAERGLVFLPLGQPSYDKYGADRKGMNLYGDCVVALDANTGKLKWYYQFVHRDIWDYDTPAPPVLIDVVHDGKTIPAIAQITKMGLLFILDRLGSLANQFMEPKGALCPKVTFRVRKFCRPNRSS
jgi:glucose dehydrogenase